MEGMRQEYTQSQSQPSVAIPLTVMDSTSSDGMPGPQAQGLEAPAGVSVAPSMMIPQTVRLPTGETVALMTPVMMESGVSAVMPLLDGTSTQAQATLRPGGVGDAYAWRSAVASPVPLQDHVGLSRTPSLKDSEGDSKSDPGDSRQTRIARFQVTKVVEDAVRRGELTFCRI